MLNKAFVVIPIVSLEIYEEYILTLRHEMQHCRQRDGLWNHILAILGIICWWNPAYQLVKGQNNHIQEICCDQAVMNKYRISKKEYALVLLKIKNEKAHEKENTRVKFFNSNVFFDRMNQIFYRQMRKNEQFFNWARILFVSSVVAFSSVWSVNATADVFIKNFNNTQIKSLTAKEIK